ncbi:hypothetical protein [Hyphomicrobium sp. NDB2Meth4]|uniref:hypothetical protein n=1 Tax=Hyphomicrobium sp. NDB2Meth4 TaxID=1892846 RepID=UPI000931FFFA|nr:hypothetical protein [Hyphomicrobium sp. NDB2Meth4]
MNRLAHPAAAAVGIGILACVTHAAIVATGGYSMPTAPLLIALACGLATGAAVTGIAWGQQRRTLAILLVFALGAGEAYALLMTAERTLAHRESQQAPLREAAAKHEAALARVNRARDSASQSTVPSPRLLAAEASRRAAEEAVRSEASKPGCRENCRLLLQQAVDAAALEVRSARAEIAAHEAKEAAAIDAERRAAQAELDANPAPPSATPLADRLGVEAWRIDLLAAALASIAANGLAAILIAFASHSRRPEPHAHLPTYAEPVALLESGSSSADTSDHGAPAEIAPARHRRSADEAARFACDVLRPDDSGRVRLRDILPAYHNWCASRGLDPLAVDEIGAALAALISRAGLRYGEASGEPVIVGIVWADAGATLASPRDTKGTTPSTSASLAQLATTPM